MPSFEGVKYFRLLIPFCQFSAFSLEFQKPFSMTEQFFLIVGQNNFGNKIPFLMFSTKSEVILAMQQEQLKAWEDSHKMNTFEVLFEYLVCSALKCCMRQYKLVLDHSRKLDDLKFVFQQQSKKIHYVWKLQNFVGIL